MYRAKIRGSFLVVLHENLEFPARQIIVGIVVRPCNVFIISGVPFPVISVFFHLDAMDVYLDFFRLLLASQLVLFVFLYRFVSS